jgi:hypothetical protein
MDEFEELTENQASGSFAPEPESEPIKEEAVAEAIAEAEAEAAAEPEPETEVMPVPVPLPMPAQKDRRTRSSKQARVDAARAEKLKELKTRYETEFSNIMERRRPKPKAYNAAAVLSAPDQEDKIKQILARDRAAFNAKQAKKTRKNVVINANASRRNAPSILAFTRSEAKRIRDEAKKALMELKARSESELRAVGSNISTLHSIFHGTRRKPGPKSKQA